MEHIKTRKSIRNYTGERLTEKDSTIISDFIDKPSNLIGPFGNSIKIMLKTLTESKSREKIGTYGFVKNAPAFLISACKNNKEHLLDLGFVFENLILYLEKHGLSTCWLGGTFHRQKLQMSQNISEEEFIPIISPVGYATEQLGYFQKLIRNLAKSDQRKDFDELFFYNDFLIPISDASQRALLEYVRLAPSASNKQPWRIMICDNEQAHFFMERTPKYGSSLGYDIQMVDMGIALSHYLLVSGKEEVFILDPAIDLPNENYSYVFSVK